jgi:hypothetical protein
VDDLTDLLTKAAAQVPPEATNEAGSTVADAREAMTYGEYGVALGLLEDLVDGWRPTPAWWDLLIGAADLMRLRDDARWCRWCRWESVHGVIRASLVLTAGGPIPGGGIPRLLWDIDQDDPRTARVWVESAPELSPGRPGTIRLAPSTPTAWRDLSPGHRITIDGAPDLAGIATILERIPAAQP